MSFHVVLDQPSGPWTDKAFKCLKTRADVVILVDAFAYVVQQRSQRNSSS